MTLYIFDKDGTIVKSVPKPSGGDRPPNTIEEQELFSDVNPTLNKLYSSGHVFAIASNQGGVAWGIMTYGEATLIMQDAAMKSGIATWRMSPYHPKGKIEEFAKDHETRKPNPGMILDIMKTLGYPPEETVYVGDMDSDRQAAENAGVQFQWAWEFFGREKPND